jgi:PhnB protein
MSDAADGVPSGVSAIIPRLFCRDVEREIDFCINAFAAQEIVRRPGLDGKAAHAMLRFGSAMLMIESEWPGLPSRAPEPDGSSSVVMYVYVEDVDKTVESALAAGAKILRPLESYLWGDRMAWLTDPQGHVWNVAMRFEEITEEQLQGRWSAMLRNPETKG